MFKYQFEVKEEITSCENCPCVYGGYVDFGDGCRLSANWTDFDKIPDDCPLIKVTEEKEGK